jgi:hypothetical protein
MDQKHRQLGIYEPKCPTCEAWKDCGGSTTAPCDCMWEGEQRYQCLTCSYACRERNIMINGNSKDSYSEYFQAGKSLSELCISQNLSKKQRLPLLIPSQTRQLSESVNLDCAAVLIYDILSKHKKSPLKPSKKLKSPSITRKSFRVEENGILVAVLNSQDDKLEKFWASDREEIYGSIKKNNFWAVTGPTFSINIWDDSGIPIPESHSVVMQRRQNQIMQELYDHSIVPIPNIYWRNEFDCFSWIDFLTENKSINVISRDLSASKWRGEEYEAIISDFIDLILKVGRGFHIIFNGVGHAKVSKVLEQFAEIGCTCSFISSDPVLKGSFGELFSSNLIPEKSDLTLKENALNNIFIMQEYLSKISSSFSIYSD